MTQGNSAGIKIRAFFRSSNPQARKGHTIEMLANRFSVSGGGMREVLKKLRQEGWRIQTEKDGPKAVYFIDPPVDVLAKE